MPVSGGPGLRAGKPEDRCRVGIPVHFQMNFSEGRCIMENVQKGGSGLLPGRRIVCKRINRTEKRRI